MNEIRTLLALELRSLYGINKYRHTGNKKEKNRYRVLLGAWLILIFTAFVYVGGLVYGLCGLGLHTIVPAYLTAIASLLILAFGLFTAGNRIFGQRGYDILASMPVRPGSIVISRFLSVYAENLILAVAVMLPGVATYGFIQKPNFGVYFVAALGTMLIPAIPLVISTLLGTLIMAISSRMKSKSMVQTLLMVLLVVGILAGSFDMGNSAENFTAEMLSRLAQTIASLLGRIYLPALWLNGAMVGLSIAQLSLFVLASLGAMGIMMLVVAKNFRGIASRLQSVTAMHNYKIGTMESRGLLKALYVREAKRYFSSSIYVTNTIIGPIMGAVMAVAFCVTGVNVIQNALPLDVAGILPFVFAAVFCMMTTTATAISMEGKPFWVVKSLPIPTKVLLDSKILLNLSLMLPFYIVSVVAMAIATRPNLLQLLWLILIPAVIIVFAVIFGITVNLKFHSFDWEKEETVVKQSLPAVLGGFAGSLLSLVLGGTVLAIPDQYGNLLRAAICLVLLAVTVWLYRRNNRIDLAAL